LIAIMGLIIILGMLIFGAMNPDIVSSIFGDGEMNEDAQLAPDVDDAKDAKISNPYVLFVVGGGLIGVLVGFMLVKSVWSG